MALSKSDAAITQLVASGTSTTLDCRTVNSETLGLRHSNGSGAVTVAGTALVQWKANGGTNWFDVTTVRFSLTTAKVDTRTVAIPPEAGYVQVIYTVPTGPTGVTLDAELGTQTN